MLQEPNCSKRKCHHFTGVKQDVDQDGEPIEASERPVCEAFPDGIPKDIAYGDNLHFDRVPGDHDLQFDTAPVDRFTATGLEGMTFKKRKE